MVEGFIGGIELDWFGLVPLLWLLSYFLEAGYGYPEVGLLREARVG